MMDGGMGDAGNLGHVEQRFHAMRGQRGNKPPGPGGLSTIVWIIVFGSWLSLLLTILGWLLILSGTGDRAGMRLLRHLPRLAFLEEGDQQFQLHTSGVADGIDSNRSESIHPGLRLAYTVLIGWWLSAVAMLAAWLMLVTIIGIPVSRRLYGRAPRLATLAAYDRSSIQSAGGV